MDKDSVKIVIASEESDLEAKKSHFLGELRNCRTELEAKAFLEEVSRKHREARHHCFAMRIGSPGNVYERFSDDGEPQGTAGKPILALLQGENLYDVCGVVTRYFGGTLLGTGGLVRAYSDSMKEAISLAEISELCEGFSFTLKADYSMANRIKYLASTMEIYTEKEEYTDVCALTYTSDRKTFTDFSGKVREMSGGKVLPENVKEVVYHMEKDHPVIYKEKEL